MIKNQESPKKKVTWSPEVDTKYKLDEETPKKTVTKKSKQPLKYVLNYTNTYMKNQIEFEQQNITPFQLIETNSQQTQQQQQERTYQNYFQYKYQTQKYNKQIYALNKSQEKPVYDQTYLYNLKLKVKKYQETIDEFNQTRLVFLQYLENVQQYKK